MTDTTKLPEALRIAGILRVTGPRHMTSKWIGEAFLELERQHDRIAELEAQLEAVGAGGVTPQSLVRDWPDPIQPDGLRSEQLGADSVGAMIPKPARPMGVAAPATYPLSKSEARMTIHSLESSAQRVLGDQSIEQYKACVEWGLAIKLRGFVNGFAASRALAAQPAPAVVEPVATRATVRDFEEWLNANRMSPVSELFHEIVAKYSAAAAPAQPASERDEQAVFDDWLRTKCPSGDVTSVRHQWEESSEYSDFCDEAAPQPQQIAEPAAATGWKWVPLEPTAKMLQAGQDAPVSESDEDAPEDYKAVYRAMLAAAPRHHQAAHVPMTDMQADDVCQNRTLRGGTLIDLVRDVEKHHGIVKAK